MATIDPGTSLGVHVSDSKAGAVIAELLRDVLPTDREVVYLCIGSDLFVGDSLGPLVGSSLSKAGVPNVYGTLDHTLHAKNFGERLEGARRRHPNAFMLSIDACLGRARNVGMIRINRKAIRIGSSVGNDRFPPTGDASITAVVNTNYGNTNLNIEHLALSTSLGFVMSMANAIADGIIAAHHQTPARDSVESPGAVSQ